MPFVILPTNSASGGYNITNSLRFNSGSTDYLNKNFASTATSEYISTISFWIKRAKISSSQYVFGCYGGSPSVYSTDLVFTASDTLEFSFGNTSAPLLETSQVFRDVSAWYHIVYAVDTTQATSSNRVKLYVNGSQVTAFGTASYPSQNAVFKAFKNNNANLIGSSWNGGSPINMYLSEFYNIDGQALTPSSFGETDFDTGIWKPKAYTGTYGTNGFYLQFKNSASLGTDSSGNGNTFTVNNLTSIDQTTDTPTNNFCTGNPLYKYTYSPTFSEGNLSFTGTQAQWQGAIGSLGISKGKWYYEAKFTSATAIADFFVGFGGLDDFDLSNPFRNNVSFYNSNGGEISVGDTANRFETTSNYGTFANGDIIGVALDYDNKLISVYKNGSAIATNYDYGATSYPSTLINGKTISPVVAHNGSGSISMNFGNPPYSSGSYTDGAGYGNFSYSVPSGYYSLNTKNLANFG